MKFTEEFTKMSLFSNDVIDILEDIEDEEALAFLTDILMALPEVFQNITHTFTKTMSSLKKGKFQEARVNIQAFHYVGIGAFNQVFKLKYKNTKSLITGIIRTSSIIKKDEIEDYQEKWSFYANEDRLKNFTDMHHHKIYTEFKQVHTMHELINFNAYFQNYILDLMADFVEDILTRIKYTYEILVNEFPENEDLKALMNIRLDLSEKIKKAK